MDTVDALEDEANNKSGRNQPPIRKTPMDELNLKRVQDLEHEVEGLRPLVGENQRLQRCVRGVNVVGRALQDAKKEVKYLREIIHKDIICDPSTKQADEISRPTDDLEGAMQNDSFIMPYITVPPNSGGMPTLDNTPTPGARLAKLGEAHPEYERVVGEKDQHHQDMEKGENDPRQSTPVKIKNTVKKTPDVKQVTESKTSSQDDTEDVAAVEDWLKELSTPSEKTTPLHVDASGVAKSGASGTNDGISFGVKRMLAMHEQSDLQKQIKELKKVNLDWGKFCKQQKSTWMAQLEEKDTKIMGLQKELDDIHLNAERQASQYDQMLLTAKTRIDKIEERDKELQSKLDMERNRNDKSDQLSRNLAKQNQSMAEEIMRLKEALERHHQKTARQSQSPPDIQAVNPLQSTSPETGKKLAPSPFIEINQKAPKAPKSPIPSAPPVVAQQGGFAPLPLMAPADEVAASSPTKSKHGPPALAAVAPAPAPYTPRDPEPGGLKGAVQKQGKGVADKSYSKEELKEQLGLLRQQNQMFHSDFNKENADKVQAMEKLQNLQRQLDKSQGRLQDYGHRDKPKEHGASKFDDAVKSSKAKGPKQEVYKPPTSDSRVKPQKAHRTSETLAVNGSNNVTVIRMGLGGQTTCKLTEPTAVIIHTEPEGQRLKINLMEVEAPRQNSGKKRIEMEPFVCPRCERVFSGKEWDSYEHHVTLCCV